MILDLGLPVWLSANHLSGIFSGMQKHTNKERMKLKIEGKKNMQNFSSISMVSFLSLYTPITNYSPENRAIQNVNFARQPSPVFPCSGLFAKSDFH